MTDFYSIRQSVDSIRDSIDRFKCPATESDCDDILGELNTIEYELDQFEPDEPNEFFTLIPETMSVGDADSLKQLILDWRKERGYGIPS